jgi:hypothetical protein
MGVGITELESDEPYGNIVIGIGQLVEGCGDFLADLSESITNF